MEGKGGLGDKRGAVSFLCNIFTVYRSNRAKIAFFGISSMFLRMDRIDLLVVCTYNEAKQHRK